MPHVRDKWPGANRGAEEDTAGLIHAAEASAEQLELQLKIEKRCQLTEQEKAEERESIFGFAITINAENMDTICDEFVDTAKDQMFFIDAINMSLGKIRLELDQAREGAPQLVEECRLCFNSICFFLSKLMVCRFLPSVGSDLLENVSAAFARPSDGLCLLVSDWCNAILCRDAPHLLKQGRQPKFSGIVEQIECMMGIVLCEVFYHLRDLMDLALAGCNRHGEADTAAAILDTIFLRIWPPGKRGEVTSTSHWPVIASAYGTRHARCGGQVLRLEDLRYSRWMTYAFLRMATSVVPRLLHDRCINLAESWAVKKLDPVNALSGRRPQESLGVLHADHIDLQLFSFTNSEQDRSTKLPIVKDLVTSFTVNDLGGATATVNHLKRFLVWQWHFPPALHLCGSSTEWQPENLNELTTLSLSSAIRTLEAASIIAFDMHKSRTHPVAEICLKRTQADPKDLFQVGPKGTMQVGPEGQDFLSNNCFMRVYGLKVSRGTPVVMTRLLCNLRREFNSLTFLAQYRETRNGKRAESDLDVRRQVLPRHGFSGTPAGVNEMEAEAQIMQNHGETVVYNLANCVLRLLDDPSAGFLKPQAHDHKERALQSRVDRLSKEAVTANRVGLIPSSVEMLVGAHGIIARASLIENQNSLKVCGAICMALFRDDELGHCPVLELDFIPAFTAAAREAYVSTAWQRRQLVLERVRRPHGYARACLAVARADSMGLAENPAVELQRRALDILDTELGDFFSDDTDASDLASDWEYGVRDVDNKNNGLGTALHLAVREGKLKLLFALLSVGACTNIPDAFGSTPAHWSAMDQHKLALAALVMRPTKEGGSSVDVANKDGQTPHDLAKDNECEVPVESLQSWWSEPTNPFRNLGTAAFMHDGFLDAFVDRAMTD